MTIRLQRALAQVGIASRRKAEDLIRAGKVSVNGQTATLGMSVDLAEDRVVVGGKVLKPPGREVWLALHKPKGYVTTKADPGGRATVYDLLPKIPGLTYVGRLDQLTTGLLLFTNNGDAVHQLTHPRFGVERDYRVLVQGPGKAELEQALRRGVSVDDRAVNIVKFTVRAHGKRVQLHITLAEGRNRIVRRLCEALGYTVLDLVRLSHGPVSLGTLPLGQWRYLTEAEQLALTQPRGHSP